MFKLYEVDPDADTLLIVPSSSAPFAEWHEGGLTNGALANGHQQPHHHKKRYQVNGAAGNGVNGHHSTNGLNGLVNGVAKVSLNGAAAAAPSKSSSPELRLKVSSKHLSLASRHFGNKFKWNSAAQQPDGRVHVTLDSGVDPVAATVVMNIIHGRGHKVPRQIDLDALARIAVFVDRYRCYDAVEAYADRWIRQLLLESGGGVPEEYGRGLILWIYVAYVFHQADLFRRATAVAISKSTGPIPDLGLPIREKIIRSLDSQRQELLIQAVTIIHDALGNGSTTTTAACTIGVDSFLQSALVSSLSRAGVSAAGDLSHLATSKPFHGLGFGAVAAAAREVEELHERWHATAGQVIGGGQVFGSKVRKRKSPNSAPEQPNGLATPPASPGPQREEDEDKTGGCAARLRLTPLLRAVEAEIGGLDLESSLGYYLY